MTDVMANQVPIMFSSVTQVLPNVRTGRLKLLAVGAAKRSPAAPDAPTISEAGVPGYEVSVWWRVVVPAGTKAAALNTLRTAIHGVLEQPETQQRLAADAAEPVALKPGGDARHDSGGRPEMGGSRPCRGHTAARRRGSTLTGWDDRSVRASCRKHAPSLPPRSSPRLQNESAPGRPQ